MLFLLPWVVHLPLFVTVTMRPFQEMSEADIRCIDLSINSDLINAKFDNYKLSLERLTIKELSLPLGGNVRILCVMIFFSPRSSAIR